jgi:2',3'-cyclic-nucleotide 2'-phosphodiesterase (5'-nucleotidase family)
MRRSSLRLLTAGLFLLSALASAQVVPFVILHTNDVHGQMRPLPDPRVRTGEAPLVGGYAELVQAIDEERAKVAHSFLVDAGDWYQGTPEGTLSHGRASVELMNAAGYDLAVLGNHEFDSGQAALRDLLRLARFPVVGRNVVINASQASGGPAPIVKDIVGRISSGVTIEVEGVRIRFDGLLSEESPDIVPEKLLSGLAVEDEVPAAQRLRAEVPPGGVDVRVLVNHIGRDRNVIIARDVPGFDVIIGGHDHRQSLDQGTLVPSTGTLIAQAATHTRALGIVEMELDIATKKVVKKSARLRWIQANPDLRVPRIHPIIERYERAVKDQMDVPVCEVAELLVKDGTPERPSPLGAWITAAMLRQTGADVAVHNLGGIRASLAAGPARVREFFQISPFGNRVTLITLKGSALQEIVELTLSQWSRGATFGGFEIEWSRDPEGKPRLVRMLRGGQPIGPDDSLRVVTTDYLASGNDRLTAFKTGTDRDDRDQTLMALTIAAAEAESTIRPIPTPCWRLIQ